MNTNRPFNKNVPVLIRTWGNFPRRNPLNDSADIRLRVIQYPNQEYLVDMREFKNDTEGSHYTPKGMSFTKKQFEFIMQHGQAILDTLNQQNKKEEEANAADNAAGA